METKKLRRFAKIVGKDNLDKYNSLDFFTMEFYKEYRDSIPDRKDERGRLAWEWYNFLKYSDYLKEITRLSVFGSKTQLEIANLYGKTETAIKMIVFKDLQRMKKNLRYDFLDTCIYKDFDFDLEFSYIEELKLNYNFYKNVQRVGESFGNNLGYKSKLMLNFKDSQFDRNYNNNLTDDDFIQYLEILKYYSIPFLNSLESIFDKEYIGYVNYLLEAKDNNLTEKDRIKKSIIINTLKLNDDRDNSGGV